MTFVTQSYPIGSIFRIVGSISIDMVNVNFFLFFSAFFARIAKQTNRFSYPNFLRVLPSIRLEFVVTNFRTKFFPFFVFIWLAFKNFQTKFTSHFWPRFNSKSFSKVPMRVTSKFFRVGQSIGSIMAQFTAIFVPFSQRREKKIFSATKLTGALNFTHTLILSGEPFYGS